MKKTVLILFLLVVAAWSAGLPLPAVAGGDYALVAGIIDTRTTFSDGALSVDALARLARERGFDALFYNDHDILAWVVGQTAPPAHLAALIADLRRTAENVLHPRTT